MTATIIIAITTITTTISIIIIIIIISITIITTTGYRTRHRSLRRWPPRLESARREKRAEGIVPPPNLPTNIIPTKIA